MGVGAKKIGRAHQAQEEVVGAQRVHPWRARAVKGRLLYYYMKRPRLEHALDEAFILK